MITFDINPIRNYVIISVRGAPAADEFIEAALTLAEDHNFTNETDRICDFSRMDPLDLTNDPGRLAQAIQNLTISGSARTAVIARGAIEAFFMDKFTVGDHRVRLFENGRDALGWVLWSEPQLIRAAS